MTEQSAPIEWGIAQMAQPGQTDSGDNYLVEATSSRLFIGVIDGLGHGTKAAKAAQSAVEAMQGSVEDDLISVVKRCHQALIGTRGAVMSLAAFDIPARTLTWISVGNVTGILLRGQPNGGPARQHLLLRGGVVGYRLPPLRTFTENLYAGDTLIFATDGLRSGFLEDIPTTLSVQATAEYLLKHHNRQTDDALVLVARYRA